MRPPFRQIRRLSMALALACGLGCDHDLVVEPTQPSLEPSDDGQYVVYDVAASAGDSKRWRTGVEAILLTISTNETDAPEVPLFLFERTSQGFTQHLTTSSIALQRDRPSYPLRIHGRIVRSQKLTALIEQLESLPAKLTGSPAVALAGRGVSLVAHELLRDYTVQEFSEDITLRSDAPRSMVAAMVPSRRKKPGGWKDSPHLELKPTFRSYAQLDLLAVAHGQPFDPCQTRQDAIDDAQARLRLMTDRLTIEQYRAEARLIDAAQWQHDTRQLATDGHDWLTVLRRNREWQALAAPPSTELWEQHYAARFSTFRGCVDAFLEHDDAQPLAAEWTRLTQTLTAARRWQTPSESDVDFASLERDRKAIADVHDVLTKVASRDALTGELGEALKQIDRALLQHYAVRLRELDGQPNEADALGELLQQARCQACRDAIAERLDIVVAENAKRRERSVQRFAKAVSSTVQRSGEMIALVHIKRTPQELRDDALRIEQDLTRLAAVQTAGLSAKTLAEKQHDADELKHRIGVLVARLKILPDAFVAKQPHD